MLHCVSLTKFSSLKISTLSLVPGDYMHFYASFRRSMPVSETS